MQITVHTINPANMAYWQKPKNYMRPMDFERDYLPGVVSGEMGNCSQIEALKAQAIAARSYAYQYILKGAAIYDTGKAQVFSASRAVSKNYLLHRQAAEETAGIVICWKGKPANTHYSASNGGYVQKSRNAWEPGGYADPWDNGKKCGHGSGMSQIGAQNMARAGKNYREILSFYYPLTELKSDYGKSKVDADIETEGEIVEKVNPMQKVIAFARAQLGEPYDLGDHGPNRWDCSGLTMEAVKQIGLKWEHHSDYQWLENIKPGGDFGAYGKIGTLPLDKDAFLFNYGLLSSGKKFGMKHVGMYAADKQSVIQAGGWGGKGVHEDPISGKKFKPLSHFTHWATLKDGVGGNAPESTQDAQGSTFPTLRKGSEGEEVKTLQNLLNQHGAALEVDGKFGRLTEEAVREFQDNNHLEEDGIAGPDTWKALTA